MQRRLGCEQRLERTLEPRPLEPKLVELSSKVPDLSAEVGLRTLVGA